MAIWLRSKGEGRERYVAYHIAHIINTRSNYLTYQGYWVLVGLSVAVDLEEVAMRLYPKDCLRQRPQSYCAHGTWLIPIIASGAAVRPL